MSLLDVVSSIRPGSDVEAADQEFALSWLASTPDVYRRVKPATPDPHLVSYVVPAVDGRFLLGEHVTSGLWLPPGGHVEPGESPAAAALREAREELDVGGDLSGPVLLTVTRTVGRGPHTDVSLWYVLRPDGPITVDPREFRSARWCVTPPGAEDPAWSRFLAKVA